MNLNTPSSVQYRFGREDLEELACTAPPLACFLYLSTCGMSVRPGKPVGYTRLGDGHAAPESLCKDDCLPRLMDAVMTGRPEDAFHVSWADRVPQERRDGEAFLGYDPQGLRRFWNGDGDPSGVGHLFPVEPSSDEFYAVEEIFRSNPADKNYQFDHDWTG